MTRERPDILSEYVGEKHPRAKLRDVDVTQIRKMLVGGMTCVTIASLFDVSTDTISNINCEKTWRHLPPPHNWNKRPKIGYRSKYRQHMPSNLNVFSPEQVIEICQRLIRRETHKHIASIMCVAKSSVDDIACDLTYKHVPRPPGWETRLMRVSRRHREPTEPRLYRSYHDKF